MKKKKQTKNEKKIELFNITLKGVDKETNTLTAVFSTADEDRHGDKVTQDWELKHFKKNPVILNSHNYHDATEVVGKATRCELVAGKLEGDIEFAVEENPKAKVIFDLYAGGFLNAFSVGFMPLEFDKDYNPIKSELLEVSAVSVPANAMALAKSKGIDVDVLDDEDIGDDDPEIEEKFTPSPEDDEPAPTKKPKTDDEPVEDEETEEVEDEPTETEDEDTPTEEVDDDEEVVDDEPKEQPKSITQRYANALKSMREKRKSHLTSILKAIEHLSETDESVSPEQRKIDTRRIHKAVRKLAKDS